MRTGRKNRVRAGHLAAGVTEALEPRLLMARDLYVDSASPGPTFDGSSWASAYTDLQLALAAATAGDRVLVAAGTYRPTATTDRTISFALEDGVSLLGGYAGSLADNPYERQYETILSGDIGLPDDSTDNSYHVVVSKGVGAATLLDGFTITAGNANGYGENGSGGGLYNDSSPTLNSCTFTSNTARDYGGGVYNDTQATPASTKCAFVSNSAKYGGGVCNYAQAVPTFTNCTFMANYAVAWGGGMYSCIYASPKLTSCAFNGNGASRGGGACDDLYSSSTLKNCTFSNNQASYGAGFYSRQSSPIFTNCTFSTLGVGYGSALDSERSSPTLTNCILWGNGNPYPPVSYASGTPVITYSDVEHGYPGIGNIDADPQFIRDPSLILDSRSWTNPNVYGNLRPRPASPCIDAGSSAAPGLAGITADLAGNPRITGQTVDMGAYEFNPPPTVASVTINDGLAQRSMVTKVVINFSEPVWFPRVGLVLQLSSGANPAGTTVNMTNASGDQKTYLLTFSGSGTVGGSLADGVYDLTILSAWVQDLTGSPLTASYTQRFHRLFGDSDGNRIVNALDYARLKQTFGRAPSDPLFNSAFDYEGNGLINALDLARFRQRYGLSFSY